MEVSAYAFAVKKLSRRSYSVRELKQKILDKGYAEEEAGEALERLLALGYLNDRELSEKLFDTFTRQKPCGPKVLAQQLRQRGLPDELIRELLLKFTSAQEYELLEQTAAKLLRTKREIPPRLLIGRLQRKGFSTQNIRKYLDAHAINYVDKS